MDATRPIRAIILGAGYRGRAYAAYAAAHPDQLAIVGVADPFQAATIPAPRHWTDWHEALVGRPDADVVFVTLPDAHHYPAAMAALDAGYHLLLEKPIARSAADCEQIIRRAQSLGRLVLVGHVLRYARYFAHIKALLDSGELGEIVSIVHQESVGFLKAAHSFCRGNWANSAKSTPIVVQKCSHDFDLFSWWIERHCRRVSSFGSIREFRTEMAPAGAARRCWDCPAAIERDCIWSAKRMYLERDDLRYMFADRSDAAMYSLVRDSDYGRCVYACDNDVPDHQCVNLEFEGGATVSHVLTAFTAANIRTTRISCTRGEIVGDGVNVRVCRFDGNQPVAAEPKWLTVGNPSRHDGADFNLVAELVRLLRNADPSNPESVARLNAVTGSSLESHLIAFAAERSRLEGGRVVEL